MKSKKTKIIVSVVLAAALSVLSCFPVSADSYSTWTYKYSSFSTLTYRFRARLELFSHGVFGTTYLESVSGAPMMVDSVAIKAILLNSNNIIVSQSAMVKISNATTSFAYDTYCSDSNTYHARGYVKLPTAKSGNTYSLSAPYPTTDTASETFVSGSTSSMPDVPLYYSSLTAEGYEPNAKGETYGKITGADNSGVFPDLIAAVGVNGNYGYVRYEDSFKDTYDRIDVTIPLYDSNGNVIDTFILSGSEVTSKE